MPLLSVKIMHDHGCILQPDGIIHRSAVTFIEICPS
jgi:hypothetical protein